jgi:hypothetical protein
LGWRHLVNADVWDALAAAQRTGASLGAQSLAGLFSQTSSLMYRPRPRREVTVTVKGLEFETADSRLRIESLTVKASIPLPGYRGPGCA